MFVYVMSVTLNKDNVELKHYIEIRKHIVHCLKTFTYWLMSKIISRGIFVKTA